MDDQQDMINHAYYAISDHTFKKYSAIPGYSKTINCGSFFMTPYNVPTLIYIYILQYMYGQLSY